MRRFISIFICITIVLSMMSAVTFSTSAYSATIKLNQTLELTFEEDAEEGYYLTFTPDHDGIYLLESFDDGTCDPICYLYDEYGEWIDENDDFNDSLNFHVVEFLEAGYTYDFEVYPGTLDEVSFTVKLTETDVDDYDYNEDEEWEEEPNPVTEDGFEYYSHLNIYGDTVITICNYIGSKSDVVIPSDIGGVPVESLGWSAFANNKNITKVTIPDTVTEIGSECFSSCTNLKTVKYSENLEFLGIGAFFNCTNLENIYIPACMNEVNIFAFDGCTNIKSIVVSPDNPVFDSRDNCNAIVHTENTMIMLACANTKFANGIDSIGANAYSNVTNLTKIDIPDTIIQIQAGAFDNTALYKNKSNWTNGVLYIGNHLIKAEESLSGEYIVKKGTVSISACAFEDCTELTKVTLPDNLYMLDSYVFAYCSNLRSINIPDTVKHINDHAFYGCSSLKNIKIPKKTETIGEFAFSGCTELLNISFSGGLNTVMNSAFTDTPWLEAHSDGLVYVDNVVYTYIGTMPKDTKISLNNSTVAISPYAFYAQKNLKEITFSKNMRIISMYAFAECTGLQKVQIPANIDIVGEGAFRNCENLTEVKLEQGVGAVYNYTFAYCEKLKSVELPSSVASIGGGSFTGCSSLEKITFYNPDCTIWESWESTIPEKTVIYGYNNSTAQQYAQTYGNKFVSLGNAPSDKPTEDPTPGTGVEGDTDGDGLVSVMDATAIQLHMAQIKTIPSQLLSNGDTDGDGVVSVMDATQIQLFLAKLIDIL